MFFRLPRTKYPQTRTHTITHHIHYQLPLKWQVATSGCKGQEWLQVVEQVTTMVASGTSGCKWLHMVAGGSKW